MTPQGEHVRRSRTPLLVAAAAAAVLAVVALGAVGSRAVTVPKERSADTATVAARFGVAAGIGAALSAAVVLGVLFVARRRPTFAASLTGGGPFRTRPFLARCLPWVLCAVALAGVLGAATAPLRRSTPQTRLPPPSPAGSAGDPRADSSGRPLDRALPTIEGAVVRDRFGRLTVSADADGDGQLDTSYVRCPAGTPGANVAPPATGDGTWLVPIDQNCDGTIDGYVRRRSLDPVDEGDAPLDGLAPGANGAGAVPRGTPTPGAVPGAPPATVAPPSTTAPPSGTDRLTGGSIAWGRLLLVLGIGLALLGLAYLALARLLSVPHEEPSDEPAAPADAAADDAVAGRAVQAAIAVLHAEPDPRTAIIDAYARLLDALAASGVPRLAQEGPEEHLRRGAPLLGIDARPLARLTELFTVARFSSHPLHDGHRAEAQAALDAAAADLERRRAAMFAAAAPGWSGSPGGGLGA